MTDYQANSKASKGQVPGPHEKNLEAVVTGVVTEMKPTIARKLKDSFIAADWKSTGTYVFWNVMLPAAKNMLWDVWNRAGYRTFYGQDPGTGMLPPGARPGLHGQQTHITYNQQVQRAGVPWQMTQRPQDPRLAPNQIVVGGVPSFTYIVSNEVDARRVLSMLQDTTETYGVATVADLHTLLARPVQHTDHTWGWESVAGARAYQTREGFVIDLPNPSPV